MLPPPPSPPSLSPGDEAATGSTVGEAFAIAPDTYVVPGWWSFPGTGLGLPLGTLVVRGDATAVVDTAPAPLADDWLAAVLALVDPAEVRWIVVTAPDAVRAGCVEALHALTPRATVLGPDDAGTTIDVGRGRAVHLDGGLGLDGTVGSLLVTVPHRRLAWTDLVGGAFPRPVADVAAVDDETLVAALARRGRALRPGELERTATLDLRVLGSPVGPIARGASIGRVLELAAVAEAGRDAVGLPLAALLAPLGPEPWVGPVIAP